MLARFSAVIEMAALWGHVHENFHRCWPTICKWESFCWTQQWRQQSTSCELICACAPFVVSRPVCIPTAEQPFAQRLCVLPLVGTFMEHLAKEQREGNQERVPVQELRVLVLPGTWILVCNIHLAQPSSMGPFCCGYIVVSASFVSTDKKPDDDESYVQFCSVSSPSALHHE